MSKRRKLNEGFEAVDERKQPGEGLPRVKAFSKRESANHLRQKYIKERKDREARFAADVAKLREEYQADMAVIQRNISAAAVEFDPHVKERGNGKKDSYQGLRKQEIEQKATELIEEFRDIVHAKYDPDRDGGNRGREFEQSIDQFIEEKKKEDIENELEDITNERIEYLMERMQDEYEGFETNYWFRAYLPPGEKNPSPPRVKNKERRDQKIGRVISDGMGYVANGMGYAARNTLKTAVGLARKTPKALGYAARKTGEVLGYAAIKAGEGMGDAASEAGELAGHAARKTGEGLSRMSHAMGYVERAVDNAATRALSLFKRKRSRGGRTRRN